MGASQSGRAEKTFFGDEVNFDHFQILRAIGKGSFGKVCIVQKKDSKQMFAMKYMNKHQCVERDALKNVLREVDILTRLEHPFLVNIWFSFQDEEDLFMVTDLLLGGDLRYHIQQEVHFTEESVKLVVCELALALDYLQSKRIIHRDIKPDNILLDEEGHTHLTDFNIATVVDEGQLASSMSGTKPYIAPEIFDCAVDLCVGYSYAVDWWSLGVVAYEMLRGCRPFDIHSNTNIQDVRILFQLGVDYPKHWSDGIVDLLTRLLCVSPGARVSSIEELKQVRCVSHFDMDLVFQRKYRPHFAPPKDHLNCDPTFELEEMIVETRPLHKKKKRLAKQRSIRETQTPLSVEMDADSPMELLSTIIPEFRIYNRYQELARRERERKEQAWERELQLAMDASNPLCSLPEEERSKSCSSHCTKTSLSENLPSQKSETEEAAPETDPDTSSSKQRVLIEHVENTSMNKEEDEDSVEEDGNKNNTTYQEKDICNIENKLHSIEFIDRSPSPVERSKRTNST